MRTLHPRKPLPSPTLDKETQAVNDMFAEEDDEVEQGKETFPVTTEHEAEVIDSYDAKVYDFLTEESTGLMWDQKAEAFVRKIREDLVSSMAFFDAAKSIEEHFKREMHTSLEILDLDVVKAITYLLRLKLFDIAATDMGFTKEQAELLFFKEVESIKGRSLVKSLVNFLKNTGAEENPYGEAPIGMSRKRKDQ